MGDFDQPKRNHRLPDIPPPESVWDGVEAELSRDEKATGLFRSYLEAWRTGDFSTLNLADGFSFTSSMGSFTSAASFLEVASDLAASIRSITLLQAIWEDDKACLRYRIQSEEGEWESSDWLFFNGEELLSVESVFDTSPYSGQMTG